MISNCFQYLSTNKEIITVIFFFIILFFQYVNYCLLIKSDKIKNKNVLSFKDYIRFPIIASLIYYLSFSICGNYSSNEEEKTSNDYTKNFIHTEQPDF